MDIVQISWCGHNKVLFYIITRAAESEATVWPGVGVGAGVCKILPTLTPARRCKISPVKRRLLGRTAIHLPDNIERQEEKKRGGVSISLKCHLLMEFRLIKGNGEDFRAIAIVV